MFADRRFWVIGLLLMALLARGTERTQILNPRTGLFEDGQLPPDSLRECSFIYRTGQQDDQGVWIYSVPETLSTEPRLRLLVAELTPQQIILNTDGSEQELDSLILVRWLSDSLAVNWIPDPVFPWQEPVMVAGTRYHYALLGWYRCGGTSRLLSSPQLSLGLPGSTDLIVPSVEPMLHVREPDLQFRVEGEGIHLHSDAHTRWQLIFTDAVGLLPQLSVSFFRDTLICVPFASGRAFLEPVRSADTLFYYEQDFQQPIMRDKSAVVELIPQTPLEFRVRGYAPDPGMYLCLLVGDSLFARTLPRQEFSFTYPVPAHGDSIRAELYSEAGVRVSMDGFRSRHLPPSEPVRSISGDTLQIAWERAAAGFGSQVYRLERLTPAGWTVVQSTITPWCRTVTDHWPEQVELRLVGEYEDHETWPVYLPEFSLAVAAVKTPDYHFISNRRVELNWQEPDQRSDTEVWIYPPNSATPVRLAAGTEHWVDAGFIPGRLQQYRIQRVRGSRSSMVQVLNLQLPDPGAVFDVEQVVLAARVVSELELATFRHAFVPDSLTLKPATTVSHKEAVSCLRWWSELFPQLDFQLPTLQQYRLLCGDDAHKELLPGSLWMWTADQEQGRCLVFGGSRLFSAEHLPCEERWYSYPPDARLVDVGFRWLVSTVNQN